MAWVDVTDKNEKKHVIDKAKFFVKEHIQKYGVEHLIWIGDKLYTVDGKYKSVRRKDEDK